MPKRGAKSKLTKDRIDSICTYIENGMTNADAATLSGITDRVFYKWIAQAEEALAKAEEGDKSLLRKCKLQIELKESVEKAKSSFKAFHIQNITRASARNWTASAWMLERKYPEEFGMLDRQTVLAQKDKQAKQSEKDNLIEALRIACKDVADLAMQGDEPEDV